MGQMSRVTARQAESERLTALDGPAPQLPESSRPALDSDTLAAPALQAEALDAIAPTEAPGRVSFLSKQPVEPVASVDCSPAQMRTIHMILGSLLDYPEDPAPALAALEEVRADLPDGILAHTDQFAEWAGSVTPRQMAEHYVDTFDSQRRCALYLSYYVAGDTRLRGSAILGFRDFANAIGFERTRDELDDYLPVILELSGRSGDPLVWELLASHREGIEVMRSALQRANSPYLHLLNALAATLPEISEEARDRFHRLVSQGPPAEMVGASLQNPWSTK